MQSLYLRYGIKNVRQVAWREWHRMFVDGAFAGPYDFDYIGNWWNPWSRKIVAYAITSLGEATLGNGSGVYAVL
jgi:hypothetical protein